MPTRVGALDQPEIYGKRSLAVYASANGYYYLIERARQPVTCELWTSISGVSFRGTVPVPVGADAPQQAQPRASQVPCCVICLDKPVSMMARPCNHVI